MKQKLFFHVAEITVAQNTSAGTIMSEQVTLPSDYKNVRGLAIVSINNGGDANFKVGFNHDDGSSLQPIVNSLLASSTNVPVQDRYFPFSVPANGRNIKILTELTQSNTAAELNYQVVFVCAQSSLEEDGHGGICG